MRCSIVPLRSTGQLLSRVFVVLLRKSIPQSRNLKAAAELNVTLGKKLKATATGKSQKQKLCSESLVVFRFMLAASFHVVAQRSEVFLVPSVVQGIASGFYASAIFFYRFKG